MATVTVKGSGGVVFEMDVPTLPHRRELFDEQLAKGDLQLLADPDGALGPAFTLAVGDAPPEEEPAPEPAKRGRKADSEPTEA